MPDWGHGWNGWITICPVAMTLVVQYRIMGVGSVQKIGYLTHADLIMKPPSGKT